MLEMLKQILGKRKLLDQSITFGERSASAVKNEEVRNILEIKKPEISDLTETLEIENLGKVYAVRMDLTKG